MPQELAFELIIRNKKECTTQQENHQTRVSPNQQHSPANIYPVPKANVAIKSVKC